MEFQEVSEAAMRENVSLVLYVALSDPCRPSYRPGFDFRALLDHAESAAADVAGERTR